MRRFLTSTAGLLTTLAVCATTAGAAEAPGPAWVDQLGSQLQPLRDREPGDVTKARDAGLTVRGGAVVVDVTVSGDLDEAVWKLEAAGMDVVATAPDPLPTVEGYLPLDSIADVGRLGVTEAVLPVMGGGVDRSEGGTDIGAITSQGVSRHNLPAAIAAGGANGTGVDVGVISDSMSLIGTGLAGSQASGDLPANTQVIKEGLPGGTDEGRAMAEIIYDGAPGLSSMLFASGTNLGPVDKADSINRLAAAGADVIADDIFYLAEPFFQDGVVAQTVDKVTDRGVVYLASAGNRARQSYESTFRTAGGLHDFDPGAGVDTRNCFSTPVPSTNPDSSIQVALGWDEPVGAVTTDLDIELVTPAGAPLGTAGTTSNPTTGDPKDIARYTNTTASAQQVCVEISRFSGTRSPFMKWIEQDNFSPTPVPEFDTQSDTINPDAASAQGALAVAAVNQADPGLDTPEAFSSRGPSRRLFDRDGNALASPLVLDKPQLAAADQVATTVPGFSPFGGTSAAAPSAASVATVLRSVNPNATVKEIYATLTDPANAIDCTSSALVPDPDCGAGFILADRAVAGLDRTGAAVSLATEPVKPDGKRGWFTRKSISGTWNVADDESPIESTTGCDPITITAEGKTPVTCSAISGGGPGSATVTIKHDTKPPSKPKLKGFKKRGPLPAKRRIKCKAKDKTSGIASCKVKGYSTRPGRHKFKLTATDKAGLKSKATVGYTVR